MRSTIRSDGAATLAPVASREGVPRMTCAIVVTFNRRELLAECLQALLEQTLAPDEIIVVDNASSDGTAEMVRERFPQARLEAPTENIGGAGGFHHGLE